MTEVANMGEQLPNSNAKVFEIIIQIDGFDSILRPSMTTKNRIITEVLDSVVYVPIESVFANDSMTFVYHRSNKQQVIPGKSNENDIVILAGLEQGDKVYLQPPANADKWDFRLLADEILEKYNTKPKAAEDPAQISEKHSANNDLQKQKSRGAGEKGKRSKRNK